MCGTLASSFLKSIVNGWPAGAWSVAVEKAMFCALNGTTVPAGAPDGPPDGGGGGRRALALSICSASQASKVGRSTAWTSNTIEPWKVPHSSAHWPRYVPASSTVKSNVLSFPGTTSRLNRNFGT